MQSDWMSFAPFIIQGMGLTLQFSFVSLACGAPLGILLAAAKVGQCSWLKYLANAYTTVFRGTPLLVQLGLFYYGFPQVTGVTLSAFQASIMTFALNSAAYSSEIMRAGIQAIDEGQWQAGQVLGLSSRQTFVHIILPQALRNILPALVNEMVDLLKEVSLIATLGEMEVLRRAQIVAGQTYLYFQPLCVAAFCYFVLIWGVGLIARWLERKWA